MCPINFLFAWRIFPNLCRKGKLKKENKNKLKTLKPQRSYRAGHRNLLSTDLVNFKIMFFSSLFSDHIIYINELLSQIEAYSKLLSLVLSVRIRLWLLTGQPNSFDMELETMGVEEFFNYCKPHLSKKRV